jgi:type II secretory pathway pseudopilin PulG
MRSVLAALAVLGVLALAIAIAVTQYQERGDTQTQLERTRQELAELREQLRAMQQPRPQDPRPQEQQQPEGDDGGLQDLLGELGAGCPAAVGEQERGGLEGLLEGLTEEGPDTQEELTDVVAQRVEELRELEFDEPVDPEFLDDRELRERVRELLEEDYSREEADRDGRALKALGAIPPDADLYALAQELLAGQVAGLYEPSSETLLVESGDDPGALEELTLAHELEHALADQTLELPVPDEPDPARADGDLAGLALVEGDATLLTQVYGARHIGPLDALSTLGDLGSVVDSQRQLAALSPYLRNELLFPYAAGAKFVCGLYEQGGWDAVDAAYERPPASTAQILFPQRYGKTQPVDPPGPGDLGRPWRGELRTTLGAAQLLWLFEAPGGDPERALEDPMAAVAPWAGGELTVWTAGERTAVGVSLAARPGEGDLCRSMTQWYAAAFPDARREGTTFDGPRQDAVIACRGENVRLGIAPDVRTARALVR